MFTTSRQPAATQLLLQGWDVADQRIVAKPDETFSLVPYLVGNFLTGVRAFQFGNPKSVRALFSILLCGIRGMMMHAAEGRRAVGLNLWSQETSRSGRMEELQVLSEE